MAHSVLIDGVRPKSLPLEDPQKGDSEETVTSMTPDSLAESTRYDRSSSNSIENEKLDSSPEHSLGSSTKSNWIPKLSVLDRLSSKSPSSSGSSRKSRRGSEFDFETRSVLLNFLGFVPVSSLNDSDSSNESGRSSRVISQYSHESGRPSSRRQLSNQSNDWAGLPSLPSMDIHEKFKDDLEYYSPRSLESPSAEFLPAIKRKSPQRPVRPSHTVSDSGQISAGTVPYGSRVSVEVEGDFDGAISSLPEPLLSQHSPPKPPHQQFDTVVLSLSSRTVPIDTANSHVHIIRNMFLTGSPQDVDAHAVLVQSGRNICFAHGDEERVVEEKLSVLPVVDENVLDVETNNNKSVLTEGGIENESSIDEPDALAWTEPKSVQRPTSISLPHPLAPAMPRPSTSSQTSIVSGKDKSPAPPPPFGTYFGPDKNRLTEPEGLYGDRAINILRSKSQSPTAEHRRSSSGHVVTSSPVGVRPSQVADTSPGSFIFKRHTWSNRRSTMFDIDRDLVAQDGGQSVVQSAGKPGLHSQLSSSSDKSDMSEDSLMMSTRSVTSTSNYVDINALTSIPADWWKTMLVQLLVVKRIVENNAESLTHSGQRQVGHSEDSLMMSMRSVTTSNYVDINAMKTEEVTCLVEAGVCKPMVLDLKEKLHEQKIDLELQSSRRSLSPQSAVAQNLILLADHIEEIYGEVIRKKMAEIGIEQREGVKYEELARVATEITANTRGYTTVGMVLLMFRNLTFSRVLRGDSINSLVDNFVHVIGDVAADFIIEKGGWQVIKELDEELQNLHINAGDPSPTAFAEYTKLKQEPGLNSLVSDANAMSGSQVMVDSFNSDGTLIGDGAADGMNQSTDTFSNSLTQSVDAPVPRPGTSLSDDSLGAISVEPLGEGQRSRHTSGGSVVIGGVGARRGSFTYVPFNDQNRRESETDGPSNRGRVEGTLDLEFGMDSSRPVAELIRQMSSEIERARERDRDRDREHFYENLAAFIVGTCVICAVIYMWRRSKR